MHKRCVNELILHVVIRPAGPILIKSGRESGANPTLPAMNFVRTRHPITGEPTIYLPGSSLKGVIRSHCERIVRTSLGEGKDKVLFCCDPLKDGNCGKQKAKIEDTAQQYKALCLVCRMFGHTVQASHFLAADAYPIIPMHTLPVRQNVAIDRLSGGVAVGPFDMEVTTIGEFHTRLTLFNFELWQVGLLALALRDITEGRVRLGFAKSRGLGEVRLHYTALEVAYPGQIVVPGSDQFQQRLYGVGALAPDLVDAYGYVGSSDVLEYSAAGQPGAESAWGRPSVLFGTLKATTEALLTTHAQVEPVMKQAAADWAKFVTWHREGAS